MSGHNCSSQLWEIGKLAQEGTFSKEDTSTTRLHERLGESHKVHLQLQKIINRPARNEQTAEYEATKDHEVDAPGP